MWYFSSLDALSRNMMVKICCFPTPGSAVGGCGCQSKILGEDLQFLIALTMSYESRYGCCLILRDYLICLLITNIH